MSCRNTINLFSKVEAFFGQKSSWKANNRMKMAEFMTNSKFVELKSEIMKKFYLRFVTYLEKKKLRLQKTCGLKKK